MQANGQNALLETVHELHERGILSRCILSIPDNVPANIVTTLNEEGFDVAISRHDQPQRRLAEVMEAYGSDSVLVLTPYSLLPEAEGVADALHLVTSGQADMAFADEVIPPKFFMVVNKKAVDVLVDKLDHPLPPFIFPAKLAEADSDARLSISPVVGLEGADERFLWELFFAGKPSALPQDVFERFIARTSLDLRFNKSAFQSFVLAEYGLDEMGGLADKLDNMREWERSIRLAMHINHVRYLAPYFPENRGAALEIGHGKTGITAQLVGLAFEQAWGVDLFKHSREGVEAAREFLTFLVGKGLLDASGAKGTVSTPNFFNCRLEEAGLESDSIDFCFSRMVLEHIDNMPVLARELGRIVQPGGVMIHDIGTQDHEDLSHIHFEFLRHSPEEWAVMDKGTNLLRPCDFISLFEEAGFDCEVLMREVRIVRPKELHPHWEGYADDDLYCPRVVIKSIRRG